MGEVVQEDEARSHDRAGTYVQPVLLEAAVQIPADAGRPVPDGGLVLLNRPCVGSGYAWRHRWCRQRPQGVWSQWCRLCL